ncbi:MAG: hypothetical protein J3R72DRAFT_448669, partial [Linnemannia gamsii]
MWPFFILFFFAICYLLGVRKSTRLCPININIQPQKCSQENKSSRFARGGLVVDVRTTMNKRSFRIGLAGLFCF